ncbi:uncharacterized protein LOC123941623 isoform X7 [Meles meles]|uniref:uncharacterized protein LOC123941623 isoform X7 n=1 Tax=Meles meles TaxID=9662 RepID=UPI001E698549|nr:uncharacterized protein LOC123941623 isoform X7 [Meles meles]XP_045860951.1 uncharacterized protein LOC123941623 isoform X7 [Meles meles]
MMKAVSFSYMAFIMLRFFLVVHFKFQNTVMKNMHEFHLEDLIITNALLHLGFFFIIIFLWLDYHNHEKRKKEEQGEPWKENGELRGKNGELQKEIDQRRAQFRNDWQNASLYPGSAFSCIQ